MESPPQCTQAGPPPLSSLSFLRPTSRELPAEPSECPVGLKCPGLHLNVVFLTLFLSLTHSGGRCQGPAGPTLLSAEHVGDVLMRILLSIRSHTVPPVPQDVPGEVAGLTASKSSSAQFRRANSGPYQEDKHLKRKHAGCLMITFSPSFITLPAK